LPFLGFIENALPTVANALAKSLNHARFNVIQDNNNGGTPFKFVLTELVDIFRERMKPIKNSEKNA